MTRTRRHKFLQISVFFLIYSILHVISQKTEEKILENKVPETKIAESEESAKKVTPAPTVPTVDKTTPKASIEKVTTKPKASSTQPTATATDAKVDATSNKTKGNEKTNSSIIEEGEVQKKEKNCTQPAIEQFPRPLMGPEGRKRGGIIIHILVAVYTFLGLAIVCDEYFVASLDRICEELKMSPDVAGATFMAAGSSAPELATVVIGVFFAKDDIGISGVIGSAVFNIMFVISVCALASGTVSYLNWWPLVRDCFFYAISILVMLCTIFDEIISWYEALFMLMMYVVYCVVLHNNSKLEAWAQTLNIFAPFKRLAPTEQSGLVSYKTLEDDGKYTNYGVVSPEAQAQVESQEQGATLYQSISWAVVYPIHFMCRKTIPNCREEKFKNWYAFTFMVSMIWISFYSYFMVWMITIIGTTLGIPDTVMGLTFVAAGVSVPDALSSIAVIKEGYGDMAVSNAIGSNVFDILICLGLPWFIKTAIIKPGSEVDVISKGLTYSTLSLLSTVIFLLVAVHYNGWKLDKKFGIVLMIWYLVFIIFASMYELNVFGFMNPIECESLY